MKQIELTYLTVLPLKVYNEMFLVRWKYSELCNQHHNLILEHFHTPLKEAPSAVSSHSPKLPLPQLLETLSPWICLFWTFHINRTVQYVAFCDWLLSLRRTFSRFIQVIYLSVFHAFIGLNNIPLYGWTTVCLIFHLSMGIWAVSTFWLLWLMTLCHVQVFM